MKIRFYPKTKTVRTLLQGRLDALNERIFNNEAEVATLKNRAIQAFQVEADIRSILTHNKLLTTDADALQDQLALLASHGPEEVMAEVEVDMS